MSRYLYASSPFIQLPNSALTYNMLVFKCSITHTYRLVLSSIKAHLMTSPPLSTIYWIMINRTMQISRTTPITVLLVVSSTKHHYVQPKRTGGLTIRPYRVRDIPAL